jgi:hypothetical protein
MARASSDLFVLIQATPLKYVENSSALKKR